MVAAYPFVKVQLDASGLVPIATRAPGVLVILGASDSTVVEADTAVVVTSADEAKAKFGAGTALGRALVAAMRQSPGPSKIYGIKIATDDDAGWDQAFAIASSLKDPTFVVVAGRPIKAGGDLAVAKLKSHCEDSVSNGQPRIGVAYVDPTIARSNTYVATVKAATGAFGSSDGRMVIIAARGARTDDANPDDVVDADVAAAAAAAIAGRAPETSMVLKIIKGFTIPDEQKFTPAEIMGLSDERLIPIIDPALIPGESLHFAEGLTTASNAAFRYIDVVRLLDDIDFALKASLIGLIGDSRITRSGVNAVRRQLEAVLDGYVGRQAITTYLVQIPLLPILDRPETTWTAAEILAVKNARNDRQISATAIVVIGPAIHQLVINLQPHMALPAQVA